MDEKSLYINILNLAAPWHVKFLALMKMQVPSMSER